MLFNQFAELCDVLKIESVEDYPQIKNVLIPAAESAIANSVGGKWIAENSDEPMLAQLTCAMVAAWFEKPEMFGELTAGANFMISQLQARALEDNYD